MVLRSSAWSLPWEKVILMMLLTPCGVDVVNTLLYHMKALQLSFFLFFLFSFPTLSEGYNTNFLIETSENPNRPNLLLADFGISKFAMGTSASGTQSLGTLTYMPPEQLNGRPTYASDQYALAIMAYELLVGHPPFEGPAP